MCFLFQFRSGYPAQGTKAFTNEALDVDGGMNSVVGEFVDFFLLSCIHLRTDLFKFFFKSYRLLNNVHFQMVIINIYYKRATFYNPF